MFEAMMKGANETIECTGPHRYTLADLVRMAGQWSGHPRQIIRLPDALARLVALLMELLPGEPPMSRDNLDSLKVPSVATGTLPGLQRLGISPTALEAISPIALSRYRGRARLEAWRMTGHA